MRASLKCPSRSNPYGADDGVTDLQEAVLGLLEEAGIPTDKNDRIIELIAAVERAHEPVEPFGAVNHLYAPVPPVA